MAVKRLQPNTLANIFFCCTLFILLSVPLQTNSYARDLPEVQKSGVLRHLGVPYANFVTGSGDGLDTDLVKLFAKYIGVEYLYVKTTWYDVIGDLIGKKLRKNGRVYEVTDDLPVKGDIIANGLTILPWRKEFLNFSQPTFPSAVWLIARADSPLQPINPSGDIKKDIKAVKLLLKGKTVFAANDSCLDPQLNKIDETGAKVIQIHDNPAFIAPQIIDNEADASLLDVPHALIALQRWPGQIKIIGPISSLQEMGCGFSKSSPLLQKAFNEFLAQCKKNGTYNYLVRKYYPSAMTYFDDFWEWDK